MAAGILPGELFSDLSAGKLPPAHWGFMKSLLSFFPMHWAHEPDLHKSLNDE